ncbi:MAG: hypothetical protein Q9208_007538 [Pyrenodesmia sp. 3 TL-2023]
MAQEVSTSSRSPDAHLAYLIQTKLPQELRDEVLDWVLDMELCPGIFHPDKPPRFELLGVSKRLQQKYEKRIWSANTFVVGNPKFPYIPYRHFRLQLPSRAPHNITKVHLSFSIRDLGDRWASFWPKHIAQKYPGITTGEDTLKMVEDYHPHHYANNLSVSLFRVWSLKGSVVNGMPLEELTLDFSECYDFKDQWQGTRVANKYQDYLSAALMSTRSLESIKTLDILVPEGESLSHLRLALGFP